jgi:hypothetical protein
MRSRPAHIVKASEPDGRVGRPWLPQTRADWCLLSGIVVVAFIIRGLPVLRGGGLDGHLGYDDGVYFAAAVALVHGVLPYRDFLLLHPPGIAILLSPFALLAGLTDDATGFGAARLAFMAVGAVNAGLVTVLAGRYGRRAGLLSGILYAVWYSAARAERTTILIGPQATLTLLAVLLLVSRPTLRARGTAAAGMALGLTLSIQVWAMVPLAIVTVALLVGWLEVEGDPRRSVLSLLGAAAGAVAAVCLPFFLSAPGPFVRYVLIDQLARPDQGIPILVRLRVLEGLAEAGGSRLDLVNVAVVVMAMVGVAAVALVARRVPAARLWCALVVVEVGYVLVSPNFYTHYSGWLAPAAAIVLGTAAAVVLAMLERHRPLAMVAKLGYVGLVATFALAVPRHQGSVMPRASLEADLRSARCVAADAPDLLLETTGLRRDLQNGCQLVIDPTGTSYETDRGHLSSGPVAEARLHAPGYQAAMEEYFGDSDAALFDQPTADGLTPATSEEIDDALPVVVPTGSVTVMLPGPTTLP